MKNKLEPNIYSCLFSQDLLFSIQQSTFEHIVGQLSRGHVVHSVILQNVRNSWCIHYFSITLSITLFQVLLLIPPRHHKLITPRYSYVAVFSISTAVVKRITRMCALMHSHIHVSTSYHILNIWSWEGISSSQWYYWLRSAPFVMYQNHIWDGILNELAFKLGNFP